MLRPLLKESLCVCVSAVFLITSPLQTAASANVALHPKLLPCRRTKPRCDELFVLTNPGRFSHHPLCVPICAAGLGKPPHFFFLWGNQSHSYSICSQKLKRLIWFFWTTKNPDVTRRLAFRRLASVTCVTHGAVACLFLIALFNCDRG